MNRKMSAEQAGKLGITLGEPYTPPGRTASFDIPAYDDVADLNQLFKRFANTAAAYSEAGGNVSTKTAAFTIAQTDIGTTFLCNWATLTDATIGNSFTPQNGMKISFVQLGTGAVQVKALAGQVKGNFTTSGQYQGIQALYADGTWWCVPFGGSGGGGSSDVPVFNVTADTTITKNFIGGLIAVDVSDNKDKKVTVPLDDGTIPIGSIIVVSNVGPLSVPKVTLEAEDGVIIQDRANDTVLRWRSAALIKRSANLWLINAGSNGGGGTGSVPTAPELIAALPSNESAVLRWTAPLDDGGHSISSYIAESLGVGGDWVPVGVFTGLSRTGVVNGLNSGEEYTLRVRAENSVGLSDPSNTAKVTPAAAYNEATGGNSVTDFTVDGKKFRRHTFTSSGTLNVKKAASQFVVAAIGSGGSGGGGFIGASGFAGGDGGGGGAWEAALALPVGDTAITIGTGGAATAYNVGGSSGTSTVVSTITVGSGGGGQSGQSIQDSGKNPTPGTKGNQGGTSDGGNGSVATFPGRTIRDKYQLGTAGNGGGGGGQDGPGGGSAGQNGAVVVEYEISPNNVALGGDPVDVEDYLGTGETWRVHTFKSSADLVVKNAPNPFRVLCIAGGGGGAGCGPYNGGGGGGGAGGFIFQEEMDLAEGTLPVVVGQGGSGGSGAQGPGGHGGDSTFSGLTAVGGGGGQAYQAGGSDGGSGGGSYNWQNAQYQGVTGQGHAGGPGEMRQDGQGVHLAGPGGGGGGAGGAGVTYDGGPGKGSDVTGTVVTYCTGGGTNGATGAANLGNGGGGVTDGTAGTGSSGVVIVAYRIG